MKIIDIFESQLLNEMIWEDRTTAGDAIKKYPNALIHFSKIQKLGVNPSGVAFDKAKEMGLETKHNSIHHDPPGIYFYPCKWLTSEEASSSQYASEYPYYTVCYLKKTNKMINLRTWTRDKSIELAERNGWIDDFRRVEMNPSLINELDREIDPKLNRKPGGFFWNCMDYLVNVEKKSWMKMLRGVDAIIDPGYGIIARYEPAQTVVFNRSLLTIVDHGVNKDKTSRVTVDIVRKLASEYNAKLSFKNKEAILEIVAGTKKIRVKVALYSSFYPITISFYKNGHWISHSERDYNPDAGSIETWKQQIISSINDALKKSDPVFPEKELYWNSDRVKDVIRGLRPTTTRFNEGVRENGDMYVYYSDRSIFDFIFKGEVSKKDILTFTIEIEISKSNLEFKVEKKFKANTNLDVVVNSLKNSLRKEISKSGRARAILKWMRIYHFSI